MNGTKMPELKTLQHNPHEMEFYLIQANLDEGHAKLNML